MAKMARESRTVNHSCGMGWTLDDPDGSFHSQRASVVKTHSPKMGRDSCDTTTNAVAYTAYARVKAGRPCQKRSGMPSSHAAISSACVTSTADPRACHIADDGDCKSDAGRLDASLGASHPQEDMGPQAIRSALGLLALTAGLVGSGRIVSRHYLFPTEEVPA